MPQCSRHFKTCGVHVTQARGEDWVIPLARHFIIYPREGFAYHVQVLCASSVLSFLFRVLKFIVIFYISQLKSRRARVAHHSTTMAGSDEVTDEKRHVDTGVLSEDAVVPGIEFGDQKEDVIDMQRLGKKQQFKRNFSYLSTMGFISVYMATWEIAILYDSAFPSTRQSS